jgi:aspartate-semialdehyde dehydrogenase
MKNHTIAIVGATGLVGRTFLKILQEQNFPISEIQFYASTKSAGTEIEFNSQMHKVVELKPETVEKFDFALFSAGGTISKTYAPLFAKNGTIVIDNSSAWRMDEQVPLVVPEVNSEDLVWHNGIIANPNCSTIQMMLPLKPISDLFGLEQVIVSTYQSISGAGNKGLAQLDSESSNDVYTYHTKQIYSNAIFHPSDENFTDWSNEEIKMINETRKILHLPELKVSVTCVRLPIRIGHSEAIYCTLQKPFEISDIKNVLSNRENLIIEDNFPEGVYPTAVFTKNRDEVFVGRIRKDLHNQNSFWMWVVANNIRKGAATNAVQIAKKMIEMNLV